MPEPIDRDSLQAWLTDRPLEYACLLAARAALRLTPLLGEALLRDSDDRRSTILLPSLRALANASYAASSPERPGEVVKNFNAVCGHLPDRIEKLSRDTEFNIRDYRDTGVDLIDPTTIYELEQDSRDLSVVSCVALAVSRANEAVSYRIDQTKNLASNAVVISATISTISACESALHCFRPRPIQMSDIENLLEKAVRIDTKTKEYDELMLATGQDIELLKSAESNSTNVSGIVSSVSGNGLWLDDIPDWVSERWRNLRNSIPDNEGWQVWIDWYEACLAGAPAEKTLEHVLPTIPSEIWNSDVSEINERIKKSIQSQSNPVSAVLTLGLEELESTSDQIDLTIYKERIMGSISRDPRQAIGATKDMLESTMKTILHRRGKEVSENIKFPKLIDECWTELKLRSDHEPPTKSERLLGKIANNAKQIILSANELRNHAGTGHGRRSGEDPPITSEDASMVAAMGFFLVAWLLRIEIKQSPD